MCVFTEEMPLCGLSPHTVPISILRFNRSSVYCGLLAAMSMDIRYASYFTEAPHFRSLHLTAEGRQPTASISRSIGPLRVLCY